MVLLVSAPTRSAPCQSNHPVHANPNPPPTIQRRLLFVPKQRAFPPFLWIYSTLAKCSKTCARRVRCAREVDEAAPAQTVPRSRLASQLHLEHRRPLQSPSC